MDNEFRSEEHPDLRHVLPELEGEVGVELGFFGELMLQDDWSFVVKLHALLEAVLTKTIADVIGRSELLPVLSFLEMSDTRRGKVAFARALHLLDENERGFIVRLSELRNSFAHDVRNTSANLADYMSSIGKDKARAFFRALDFAPDAAGWPFGDNGKLIPRREVFDRTPKLVIWASAVILLVKLYSHKEFAKKEREWKKKALELVEEMWRADTQREPRNTTTP